MKKRLWKGVSIFSFVFVLMLTVLTGCGSSEESKEENKNEAQTEETTGAYPVTITDDAGNEVTIEKQPETIVSLLPSVTETLFALGLDEEIIGVSDYDNYPVETADKEKVGSMDLNTEAILALQPDVAFLQDYHAENAADAIEQFKEAGITVVIVETSSDFAGAYETIEMVGTATGTEEEADIIVNEMKAKVEEIKEKAKEVTETKTVWVEISPQPDLFTAGDGTFIDEMLDMIGAENVAGELEGWPKVSEEEAVNYNPDVILTTYGYYVEDAKEQVLARDGWQEVTAVKNGDVYDVDSDMVTRPGPRLVDGLEEIAKVVYPDVFQ
ncbi:MAG: ABC transporter substrate-binding protein [Bacillus sp. (in: firmicutes)]